MLRIALARDSPCGLPWTPETSAAPGGRKSGQARACPRRARRATPAVAGAREHPNAGKQIELAFDTQKERKNYTNPLLGSLHTSRGLPDTVALLERALDQTAAIIAAISASDAGLATPYPGWDVAALVRHLTGQDLRNFLASARGEAADWQAPADELGQDWAADFRDRAARLMAVWQQADLDRQLPMPGGGQSALRSRADQQIAELAMHGWDLVVATGQQTGLDPALAEHALRWSHQLLRPEFRGPDRAFGPEVPVRPDAPVYQRLAGWFGRDPNWTPPGNTADRRP